MGKKIKILHINSNYLFTFLHKELIENLNTHDFKNTVFMPVHDKASFIVKPEIGVYNPISFKKNDKYLFFNKQRKIYKSLNEHLNLKDYQLVHAHTLFTDGNVAYKLKKQYNIPYVVTVRNTDINLFFKKRLYLRNLGIKILKNASKIIFLSEPYFQEVKLKYLPKRFHNEIENKTLVIPNGINNFWLENKQKIIKTAQKNKLNLIYVGRIDKNKNIHTTIKACNILIAKGHEVTLTIVGTIADKKIFEKFANEPFINYYPKQTKEKLVELYKSSDILVMPSIFESFGLVYAEAMTQGLPVIYSKGQGFDKQFENGVVGYSVDSLNESDIVNKLLLIQKNYNFFSENCIKNCKKFDWENIANDYSLLYKDCIEVDGK